MLYKLPDTNSVKAEQNTDFQNLESLANQIDKTQVIISQLIEKTKNLAIDAIVSSQNADKLNDDFYEISNELWEMAEKCSSTSVHLGIILRKMRVNKKAKKQAS